MKKTVALLLLFVFLIGTLSGCGLAKKFLPDVSDILPNGEDPNGEDPGDEDPNGEDPNDEVPLDGDAVVKGEIFYPEDWMDIVSTFAEFGYTYTERKEDGEVTTWSMHYVSEGTEEYDGQETEVIKLTQNESSVTEYRLWYTSDWECVRIERDGEEIDLWNSPVLAMLLGIYDNTVAISQMVLQQDGTIDTASFKLENTSKESTELGNLDVYTFASLWTAFTYDYGFYEDGDLYFALIRNALKGTDQYTELRVTHMNVR